MSASHAFIAKFRGDLMGKKFGNWTVLQFSKIHQENSFWLCKCICGNERIVNRCSLIQGCSKSCGCLYRPPIMSKQVILANIYIDENSCWNWIGKLRLDGYANKKFNGKKQQIHRISYQLFIGEIPENRIICHKCDNRKCVNPDHLYSGNTLDNARDRVSRGRSNFPLGERHGNSKFTKEEIVNFRSEYEKEKNIRKLANKHKIPYQTMWKIIKRETWNHI